VSFFSSRWVERPTHVEERDQTMLPEGFRAGGVAAGIKRAGLDVGMIVCDSDEATSAARFTSSAVLGAPVIVSQQAQLGRLRGAVVSSGNANVADGDRGIETARQAQALCAQLVGTEPDRVGIAATGIIGRELPRHSLLAGVSESHRLLTDDAKAFSEAILTTDRTAKRACVAVELSGGTVLLACQAKGAGMISPHFATMFCFVETDAQIDQHTLELLTSVCVKRSFDRISVDGQLSTSDSVFCFASGLSEVAVASETEDELAFGRALDALLRQVALEIVADGEGARRVGRVVVSGRPGQAEAVARSVANSPLVKTALYGADPNFGRILQACGQALEAEETCVVDLVIEGCKVLHAGVATELEPDSVEALQAAVAGPEVEYVLDLPGSGEECELFFSDLSTAYVELNAEYS
jgi:glutamate N-acetyltransferase/amino-acid N-acetyltransferase